MTLVSVIQLLYVKILEEYDVIHIMLLSGLRSWLV